MARRGSLGWILGKDSASRGWLGTEQAPWRDRAQEMLGQCSKAQGGIAGQSCAGPGSGLLILLGPF